MDPSLITPIKSRYLRIQEQIALTARQSGRNPDAVRLVVVTKAQPMPVVRAAVEAGACILGENYAEDALEKILALRQEFAVEWHMIGHVQSRKAKTIATHFALMHSLDSIKLAGRLSGAAEEIGRPLPVLVQLNVSGEESKSGYPAWSDEQLPALYAEIEQLLAFKGIQVCGLMTMPPFSDDPQTSRPYFQRLRHLRDGLARHFQHVDWRELSMGMSGDYPVAVEEGATLVRVGTAIMGARTYA